MRRLAFAFALACLAATLAFAQGPEKVKIDAAAKKQLPVLLDHAKHGDRLVKSCDACHHTNEGLTRADAKVDVKKCSECHLDPEGDVPSMREMSPTKNPMHILCIGCHKEQRKGPVVCTGCHRK